MFFCKESQGFHAIQLPAYFNLTGQERKPVNPMRFFPVHSHKFLFCTVPKAGITNWKKVILRMVGDENTVLKSIFE